MQITEKDMNPLLVSATERDFEEVNRCITDEPKFQVGEVVDLNTWGGIKENFIIEDIKVTYHNRTSKYTWGYKLSDNERTGFSFVYIPEVYLLKKLSNCSNNVECTKTTKLRPTKDEYYIGITEAVLERSTCLRRKYGAVLVKNDEIVSTGYNGSARGEVNCCDCGYCEREAKGVAKGERYELCVAIHAEDNAITSAGRHRACGATLYIVGKNTADNSYANPSPCAMCARKIKNAGITRIVGLFKNEELNTIEIKDINI